jgi:hypothetical protein
MNQPQMDLLYLSDTGHILALFTRAGGPPQLEKVPDAFVGAGFHVRGLEAPPHIAPFTDYNNEDFVIPSNHLAFLSADLSQSVVSAPRDSYVDATNNNKLQPLQSTGASVTSPVVLPTLAITLAATPTSILNYLVLIAQESQGTPALPITGSINASTTASVTIPTLAPGNYFALVFIETYSAQVIPFTV